MVDTSSIIVTIDSEIAHSVAAEDIDFDSVVSRSRYWGTREGDIRKRLMLMTRKESNISGVYREFLRSMIASFNDIVYTDSEEEIRDIKIFHANPERAIAKIMQEANIILPVMSISQTVSNNDPSRSRYDSLLVNERVWDSEHKRARRVLSFAPRPVNIIYNLNIWCKYKSDMDQILEQIRLKFNPEMEVPTPFGTLTKGFIESEEDSGTVEALDKEDRIIRKTISILVRTYIPNPKFLVTNTGQLEAFKIQADLY